MSNSIQILNADTQEMPQSRSSPPETPVEGEMRRTPQPPHEITEAQTGTLIKKAGSRHAAIHS